jgi:BlaI family transcriptional regulator, penicillinase repressor
MKHSPAYRLGDLQLQIMNVLWTAGPATVADVQHKLPGKLLAYTTVATMLRKMEDRGLVAHLEQGRRFVYKPLARAEEVTTSMAGDLVDRLFAGSLADTVSHLLKTRDVSRRELARLEKLIEDHKKRTS